MRYLTPILVVLLLVSLIANGVMYAKWRSRRPIMTINGRSISKFDMDNYLENTQGPQYKAAMAQKILLDTEAEKLKLAPTDAEVNEEYDRQKELDWQFAQRMDQNPWIADSTKDQIREKLELTRLLTQQQEVPVTEEEIQDEYQRNAMQYDTPTKAKTEVALVLSKDVNVEDLIALMRKDIKPSTIMDNFRGAGGRYPVYFIGEGNIYTFVQPFGANNVNQAIFGMKPGDVKRYPAPPEFQRMGAIEMVIRMNKIIQGSKVDPKNDKTHEKIRQAIALKRSKPAAEYLGTLWDKMIFENEEDPNDKKRIEMQLLPQRQQK